MITDEPLATEAILEAFATAGRVLPRLALQQAADRWPEVGPILLAMLEDAANGADRSERTQRMLFFGVYLMAQVRETRAFAPLCTIAADGERIFHLIGDDSVTEDLSVIFTRLYDGDPAPLRLLIEATDADEYVRNAAVGALAWLTAIGRLDRGETAGYLGKLHATLRPQDTCYVWVGWQRAIASLGLADHTPLVTDAFDRGWIDPGMGGPQYFHKHLRTAREAAEPTAAFESHIRNNGRLDDAARHLSHWAAFRPEQKPHRVSTMAPTPRMNEPPIRDPYRGVGRNDPCPCGSGKKYKKCCLGKAR